MTLRSKLLLAQLPLAISLLVVGAVSRRTVATLDHSSQDILKDNHLSVLAAQRMRDAADALGRTALAKAHRRPAPTSAEVTDQRQTFERELAFQESNITEAGERELTQRVRARWPLFLTELNRLLGAPPEESPQSEESATGYFQRLEPLLRELQAANLAITTINQDAMVRKSDRARQSAEKMSRMMLAVTLFALLLGIVVSVLFTHRLIRPLSVLTQAVRRLGQGDLLARARLDGQDEIAQVAREFNTMAARLAEYRQSSLGELLAAQQSSQAVIDSLPDPVLVLHGSGELLNANDGAAALFGVDIESAGADAFARVPPEVLAIVSRMRESVAAGNGAYLPKTLDEAVPIALRDGLHHFLARANLVYSDSGQTIGLTILFQDVTRLRRFDELRTDMVATVAHEFRTPLTSLRMAIYLCAEGTVGPLTAKQSELLFAAREDCERLQGIVDDLLDLSRIQAGKMALHKRAVSTAALLAHAADEYRALAREHDVELTVSAAAVDQLVSADPERIQLALGNFITNAIRHTPPGGKIELAAAPTSAAENTLRFTVTDTGSGVAPQHVPRLFERFFQVPGSSRGGAGLGLYICKEVIEAHDGHVGVQSEPGQGAQFWFTLPAALPTDDSSVDVTTSREERAVGGGSSGFADGGGRAEPPLNVNK